MGPRTVDEEEQKLHVNGVGTLKVSRKGENEEEEDADQGQAGAVDLLQSKRMDRHSFHFANSTRYLVMLLTVLCLSLAMSNALALNFTVICMSKPEVEIKRETETLDKLPTANSTETSAATKGTRMPMFNSREQALLFSAVPIGTLIGTLPITPLVARFGMRKTFTAYGLVSALATMLTPVSVASDFGLLLIMRVVQGVAVSICFPASGSIISDWSPLGSSGTWIALLSCHIQFGPILTMPLAGELCESRFGWPVVYYLQAFFTCLVFCLFFAFYRDSPRLHRNVSSKELGKIELGKPPPLECGVHRRRNQIPYAAMLSDPAVWGIFLCAMGSTFGFHIFMQYGPIYLHQAIKFNVERTGFAMALPCALSALAKFIVGPASDHATCVSERSRILIFATLSQLLMAFCFCALALLPAGSPPFLYQAFFTSVTVVSGLNCAGVGKSTQMIARQFTHVLTSFSVFACSSTIILIPVMVSALAPDNTPEQWSRIFLITAVVVVLCVLVFDFTAEASPRPWALIKAPVALEQQPPPRPIQQKEHVDKGCAPLLDDSLGEYLLEIGQNP